MHGTLDTHVFHLTSSLFAKVIVQRDKVLVFNLFESVQSLQDMIVIVDLTLHVRENLHSCRVLRD